MNSGSLPLRTGAKTSKSPLGGRGRHENGAKMSRRVQVVDELRPDGRLREHELNCGLCGSSITIDHGHERTVMVETRCLRVGSRSA